MMGVEDDGTAPVDSGGATPSAKRTTVQESGSLVAHAIARLDEIDTLADGRYHYRPVRHHFGITSFGVTAWLGAAAGDPIIDEYDEDSQPAEELFVVVSGRAVFELEGEKLEAPPGTLLFTPQGTRRTAVAAEPATTILVIDGAPGKAYDATGWELWAPLRPLYDTRTPSSGRGSKTSSPPTRNIRCSSTTWPASTV